MESAGRANSWSNWFLYVSSLRKLSADVDLRQKGPESCNLPCASSVIAGVAVDFAQIVAENQSLVFSLAMHFLRDRGGAEELAQDVFLQLYRNLRQIETPA